MSRIFKNRFINFILMIVIIIISAYFDTAQITQPINSIVDGYSYNFVNDDNFPVGGYILSCSGDVDFLKALVKENTLIQRICENAETVLRRTGRIIYEFSVITANYRCREYLLFFSIILIIGIRLSTIRIVTYIHAKDGHKSTFKKSRTIENISFFYELEV